MKSFTICFVALFAVAFAKSVVDEHEYVSGFDGDEVEQFDDRILGGEETSIEKHPHQISVRVRGNHNCGGSILTAVRALTAGHCVDFYKPPNPEPYSIMAGSALHKGDANSQIRPLSRFVLHEQWNNPSRSNDIALLFWEEPLTFGANVRPIKIPSTNAPVPYGQSATASGWGVTRKFGDPSDILREVTIPLVDNDECNRAYPDIFRPNMVCAGGEHGHGACTGDSGGPLVHNNILIGITSFGAPCALQGFPGVFARVAFFVDWINQNIE